MISYQKENSGLEICYSLEYIDNKKDFDYISSGKFNRGEPWERYKKKYSYAAEISYESIIKSIESLFATILENR